MMDCWCTMPGDRKTFPELRLLFDSMLAQDNPYIQFENIHSHKAYYNISSRRNTACEDEELAANCSSSETEYEASSTSSGTLNGASAKGTAYDNLTPLLPPRTPPTETDDRQHYPLHIFPNQYVDTPIPFEHLTETENSTEEETTSSGRSSSCEHEITKISKKITSSGEIDMDINSTNDYTAE